MANSLPSRRQILRGLVAAPLAAAGARLALAAPAAGPDRCALVVVMLRGALDGLAAVPATGDPAWRALRPQAEAELERFGPPRRLDGMFSLHPALAQLHRWWGEGSLLVVHAVASPYRERSHFDAQQQLESGGARPFELSTGWLGRALAATGGRGVALEQALPLALRGAPGASSWAPSANASADADLLARVGRLYESDAQLGPMFEQAMAQHRGDDMAAAGGAGFAALARQAGRFLSAPDGPRVAWLESSGWDTHTQQAPRLARLLGGLDQGLAALRESLGARWSDTSVLVMTEFGRTAAMNGSLGTDHGTAGVAFLAGGVVAGGRVRSDWPGLARAQLFEGRDLRPTTDLRALIAPALQRHLGVSRAQIERELLPGAPAALPDLWRGAA
ncbi:DUF1501 domain-containing protein [Caldimonas sp. KR1-144]|uniref:DUF1501 domain-containing protein n=1 Tax=Caldimonas sp. KR1-144 TaxID=3400911 RepID=UPI003C10E159